MYRHAGLDICTKAGTKGKPRAMGSFKSAQVSRYYDDNTRLLLRLGQGAEGTIHRAVWGPGVTTRARALSYVDELITDKVRDVEAAQGTHAHVIDLGCGVGATLCRIARAMKTRGTGITISKRQVEIAQHRIEKAGLADRVRCIEGDFCDLPEDVRSGDVAYAIESFAHAGDARAFFAQCARALKPQGLLIVCDDFLSDATLRDQSKAKRWLDRFRKGWVIGSLVDLNELTALTTEHGFVQEQIVDLTSYLELGRPRDWGIALLMTCFGWLPVKGSYWSMLYGGHALQAAIKKGYLRYLFTVWRKSSVTDGGTGADATKLSKCPAPIPNRRRV
jgi:SAM-dependent methyltransferase